MFDRVRRYGVACAALLATSCTPKAPSSPASTESAALRDSVAEAWVKALREEATGSSSRATELYLDALDQAGSSGDDGLAYDVTLATLDALVEREVSPLDRISSDNALVYRAAETARIVPRLERAMEKATAPFVRGFIAKTLTRLLEHDGDPSAARFREASGCVRAATVFGPDSFTELVDLEKSIAPDVAGSFDLTKRGGVEVSGHGCQLPLGGGSQLFGVREVVVIAEVKDDGPVSFALRTRRAAELFAGEVHALSRPHEWGAEEAIATGRVMATRGALRLVVRVGARPGDTLELDVHGSDGKPLRIRPLQGDGAASATLPPSKVSAVAEHGAHGSGGRAARLLASATFRALGRFVHTSKLLLAVDSNDAGPEESLLEARAIHHALDLPRPARSARLLSLYDRVLKEWPGSWEATIGRAAVLGGRRSSGGDFDTLRELDAARKQLSGDSAAVVALFDAVTSARADVPDRATRALDEARPHVEKTPLFFAAKHSVLKMGIKDQEAAFCADPLRAQETLDCHYAKLAMGDVAGAARELSRLRELVGAPKQFLAQEFSLARQAGDREHARKIFDAMGPTERSLSAFAFTTNLEKTSNSELFEKAERAPDSPALLSALLQQSGDDVLSRLGDKAANVIASDRQRAPEPGAATAVLVHDETFDVLPSGLVHYVVLDVRRLSGTTDIDTNAQAASPEIGGAGRTSSRTLRRRIWKKDGRKVEPEAAIGALQGGAELAELEAGDVVESVSEGWGLEREGGVTVASSDLLPERTSVHEGTVQLRIPKAMHGTLWSHAMLGTAAVSNVGESVVYTWSLRDAHVRRIEEGAARMDRAVRFVYSTETWSNVAHLLKDALLSLDEHDPEVDAWAKSLVPVGQPGETVSAKKIVGDVVRAVGRAVGKSESSPLDDWSVSFADRPFITARTFLLNREGSRSWLVVRALRAFGIDADIVVAEGLPYSSDPKFPVAPGRFTHPLVIAHIPNGDGTTKDEWIDADVQGPPLPPGHVSPELASRAVLRLDGTFGVVPKPDDAGGDRIALDLALSNDGDATGDVLVVLQSREAAELADILTHTVGAERDSVLRDVVLTWVPSADVEHVSLESGEDSWEIAIKAHVTLTGYAGREKRADGSTVWVLPGHAPLHSRNLRPHVATLGATYAGVFGRTEALAISKASRYEMKREVTFPAPVSFARPPEELKVHASHLEASRTVTLSGLRLSERFTLSLETGTLSRGDYDAFVSVSHSIDDGFLASLRVRPPGASTAP